LLQVDYLARAIWASTVRIDPLYGKVGHLIIDRGEGERTFIATFFTGAKHLLDLLESSVCWVDDFLKLFQVESGFFELELGPVCESSAHQSFQIVGVEIVKDIGRILSCLHLIV